MTKLNLDGVVGWDIEAKEFNDQLDQLTGDLELHLNSGGGYVTDGVAILNGIRNYDKGEITAKVSYAASMMTQIALACDKVDVYDNAIFMIHNVQSFAMGDHHDLRESADIGERMSKMLANLYVNKTGKSESEILNMMDDETYLFGSEIVDQGFADSIIATDGNHDKEVATAHAKDVFQMSNKAMKEEKLSLQELKTNFKNCFGGACNLSNSVENPSSEKQANDKEHTVNKTVDELKAELQTANASIEALEAKMGEKDSAIDALKAEIEAQKQSNLSTKAEMKEIVSMGVEKNVSKETLMLMIDKDTKAEAGLVAFENMESTGATFTGEQNLEEGGEKKEETKVSANVEASALNALFMN